MITFLVLGYVFFLLSVCVALYYRREYLFFKNQLRKERAVRVNTSVAIGSLAILAAYVIAYALDAPVPKKK